MTEFEKQCEGLTVEDAIRLNESVEKQSGIRDEFDDEFAKAVRNFNRVFNIFLVALAILALSVIYLIIRSL